MPSFLYAFDIYMIQTYFRVWLRNIAAEGRCVHLPARKNIFPCMCACAKRTLLYLNVIAFATGNARQTNKLDRFLVLCGTIIRKLFYKSRIEQANKTKYTCIYTLTGVTNMLSSKNTVEKLYFVNFRPLYKNKCQKTKKTYRYWKNILSRSDYRYCLGSSSWPENGRSSNYDVCRQTYLRAKKRADSCKQVLRSERMCAEQFRAGLFKRMKQFGLKYHRKEVD